MSAPESTYLAWLDMRDAGLGVTPQATLLEQAGVALSDGADFGNPGFVRLNFGTTATQLDAALERMDTLLKMG
jgi:cystathionine beta-lyase